MSNSQNEISKRKVKMPNNMTLENRRFLAVSGVLEVDSFDDKVIQASTDLGLLIVKGENLNIKKLNLELGDLEVEGKISELVYKDKTIGSQEGFFSRLFK